MKIRPPSISNVVVPLGARLLGDLKSPTKQPVGEPDLDFVLILVTLLCALICILGLTLVVRCTCLRRNSLLPNKVLNALPKRSFIPDDAGKVSDCPICLAEFATGDEIRVLPVCGHCYHVACIDTWLRKHSSCPSCRLILAGARC